MIRIPLTKGAQRFSIMLGSSYCDISLIWRDAQEGGGWFMDIAKADGSAKACGIPVLPGSDLLGQIQHRGLGHMYCTVNGRTDRAPTYDDMGGALSLYWEA